MTDPFPDFLLESRVIVDKRWKCVTDLRFIDDNSRLEKKIGKRIRHALEDIVGLKQAAFRRLANIARRDILRLKIVWSVAGDRVQTVQFALTDFYKSRFAMQGRTLWCYTASFARFGCLFQTLQAKTTLLINIHIEQVPATLNYVYARLQQTVQKKNFLVVMPRAELLRHTVVVLSVILSVRYAYLVTRWKLSAETCNTSRN